MTEDQKDFRPQTPDQDIAKFEERDRPGDYHLVKNNQKLPADYPAALADPDPFIAMVERLSANPNVDVDKLERILNMQERILDRNAEAAFNESFSKAQSKIDLVVAESENKQTKSNYAKLSDILIKAKHHWESEGFALMFYEGDTPKEDHKRTMVDIRHNKGHTVTRHIDLAVQTTGIAGKTMMTLIHGQGSSFSYGRRYLTCMVWNIPTGDDDDGNAAGKQPEYITEDQAADFAMRLKVMYGDNISMFLSYMGYESVENIPAKEYKKAEKLIKDAEKKFDEKMNSRLEREPGQEK